MRGVSNPREADAINFRQGDRFCQRLEGKGSSTARTTEKKGIPFIKIADHVDVNFHRKGKRVGEPKE